VLKPLKKSTKFLSHEWATLSAVMPLIFNVIHVLQPASEGGPVITTFKKDLVDDLSALWALLFTNVGDRLLMAVYLDPHFKTLYWIADPHEEQSTMDHSAACINKSLLHLPTGKLPISSPTKPLSPPKRTRHNSTPSSYMQEMGCPLWQ